MLDTTREGRAMPRLLIAGVILLVLSYGSCRGDTKLSQAEQDQLLKAALQSRSDAITRLDRLIPAKRKTHRPEPPPRSRKSGAIDLGSDDGDGRAIRSSRAPDH